MPHIHMLKVPTAVIGLVGLLLPLAGCKKLEVKKDVDIVQDTPQGSMATIIKLYEAGGAQRVRVSDLVDPLLVRMDARAHACAGESLVEASRDNRCHKLQLKRWGRMERGLPSNDDDAIYETECGSKKPPPCVCSEKGNAAVAKAEPFASTETDKDLAFAGFDSTKCQINSVTQPTTPKEARELVQSLFERDAICSELAMDDEKIPGFKDTFSRASITCNGREMHFVFRKSDNSWKLLGLEQKTALDLRMARVFEGGRDAEKKRREDLNKDLK